MRDIENFYIYNPTQAIFFIQHGADLTDLGYGSKGNYYHKFPRNEKNEQIFMEWKRQKYGDKAR